VLSLLEALQASVRGSPPHWRPKGEAAPSGNGDGGSAAAAATAAVLQHAQRSFGGPVAVFPEGAPTNNRAVLVFAPVAEQVADAVAAMACVQGGSSGQPRVPTTHVIALKYGAGGPGGAASATSSSGAAFSPCFTAGSVWAHAWHLAGQRTCCGGAGLTAYRLPEGHDPQPADFAAVGPAAAGRATAGPYRGAAAAAGEQDADPAVASSSPASSWSMAVRDALTQLLRGARAVALGAPHYDEFLAVHRQSLVDAARKKGR